MKEKFNIGDTKGLNICIKGFDPGNMTGYCELIVELRTGTIQNYFFDQFPNMEKVVEYLVPVKNHHTICIYESFVPRSVYVQYQDAIETIGAIKCIGKVRNIPLFPQPPAIQAIVKEWPIKDKYSKILSHSGSALRHVINFLYVEMNIRKWPDFSYDEQSRVITE